MSFARFHVFSGTGNSLHLARRIAAALEARGWETELREIAAPRAARLAGPGAARVGALGPAGLPETAGSGREEGRAELELFVFPVYAMSVPRIVKRYLAARRAPAEAAGEDAPRPRAAILTTNGRISLRFRDGHEGQALAQAERLLSRRGWRVVYRETFDYPQSIANVLPISSEEKCARIIELQEPRLAEIAEELAAGRERKRPCGPLVQLLGWPFGWLYQLGGRRAFALLFAADERCDGCGACARSCPARAITLRDGRPDWSLSCEGCERCINLCPRKAIQTSLVRLGLMLVLVVGADYCPLRPFLAALLTSLPGWLFEAGWTLLALVLGFALFRLLSLVLHLAGHWKPLRALLAFGPTRFWRRYPRP